MSRAPTSAATSNFIACHTCGLLSKAPLANKRLACPRCRAALHSRIPRSLQRTWAMLIAGILLYVPANIFPIMHVTSLGQTRSDTILSGAIFLLEHGMWPLALIVFVASIMVPFLKITILLYLVISAGCGSTERRMDRARLYRFTEFVGRWSMVDVFVVAVLVALVHLGNFATIKAGPGALFFGIVVVLTMLAAHSFDPRLIWDPMDKKRDQRRRR